jgi:hypothetical protein
MAATACTFTVCGKVKDKPEHLDDLSRSSMGSGAWLTSTSCLHHDANTPLFAWLHYIARREPEAKVPVLLTAVCLSEPGRGAAAHTTGTAAHATHSKAPCMSAHTCTRGIQHTMLIQHHSRIIRSCTNMKPDRTQQ